MKSLVLFGCAVVLGYCVSCTKGAAPPAVAPDEPVEPPAESSSELAPAEPASTAEPPASPPASDQSSPRACVESFLANLKSRNRDGALAMGTQEWQAAELGGASSFVNAVFNEGLKVERWTIGEVEGEGDSASVRARTLLLSAEGEEDNEPMGFTLLRIDDQWWIIELN